jgi:hypothetical protein
MKNKAFNMTENSYEELKKLFYDTPDWIRKKQIRELRFFAGQHYRFFHFWMNCRLYLSERRLQIVKRNLAIQERAYVLMSCKILFTEKFKNSLLKEMEGN